MLYFVLVAVPFQFTARAAEDSGEQPYPDAMRLQEQAFVGQFKKVKLPFEPGGVEIRPEDTYVIEVNRTGPSELTVKLADERQVEVYVLDKASKVNAVLQINASHRSLENMTEEEFEAQHAEQLKEINAAEHRIEKNRKELLQILDGEQLDQIDSGEKQALDKSEPELQFPEPTDPK